MGFLQNLIPGFGDLGWAPSFLKGQRKKNITELCELILTSDGEYSSLILADQVLNRFSMLDETEKVTFFDYLSNDMDVDKEALHSAAIQFCESSSPADLENLNLAIRSPRRRVLQALNQVQSGTHRLVEMRNEVLKLVKIHPHMLKLSNELLSLFGDWFNRGFLELRQIDWTTPAHILEKNIEYEAVHEIGNWRELRARLEPEDRFCFAFFHPCMSEEPLVFVEVALTMGVPDQLDQLLNTEREKISPAEANCAVFYSISNCHQELSGVSFGNYLIKQVATSLEQKYATLKTFATLSPAPTFSKWLDSVVSDDDYTEEKLPAFGAQYYLQA